MRKVLAAVAKTCFDDEARSEGTKLMLDILTNMCASKMTALEMCMRDLYVCMCRKDTRDPYIARVILALLSKDRSHEELHSIVGNAFGRFSNAPGDDKMTCYSADESANSTSGS